MKNHIKVGGKLLQTNKKWSHLKQKQREWIATTTKNEYDRYIATHKKTPGKSGKLEIIDTVYDKINERELWIPFYEVKENVGKHIERQNRKAHDIVGEDGETVTVVSAKKPKKIGTAKKSKPKPPTVKFGEIDTEIKEYFYENMKKEIALYINYTAKIPPNKLRDNHLKNILKGFNAKLYKKTGAKVLKDDVLLSAYDDIRKELLAEYNANGKLYVETKKAKANQKLAVLETDRLRLRKMHRGDVNEISHIISDIEVMYAWEQAFTTKKDSLDWIIKQCRRYKNEQVGYFLAIEKSSGEVVGQIGLMWNEINGEKILEVGYILKKTYWHKGYATEGAKACLKYAFDLFDISKIVATIRPENETSIALAERIGMKMISQYDKEYDGKLMKHFIYEIGRSDII